MKPILYQPGSKTPLVLACAAAAAIHISALGFSPVHQPVTIGSEDSFPYIDVEPAPPAPEPEASPQVDEPVQAPTAQPNDFSEMSDVMPRPLSKRVQPIRASRAPASQKLPTGNGKLFAVSAPRPNYPYEARSHHITGTGAVVVNVNPATGAVLSAAVTESTGSPLLDNSALSAFRRWQFRTGSPPRVKIPFTFTMFGAQL